MKNYLFISLCLIALAFSCKKLPNDGIPSYIKLSNPSISVEANQGAAVHSFSDLWINTEGLNLGAYEYPTTIAAYIAGDRKVVINPGILDNRTSERRIHPAYKPYGVDVSFVQKDTVEINPVFEYKDNINFLYIEDFENNNNFDEMTRTSVGDIENQTGRAGVITISGSDEFQLSKSISPFEIVEGSRVYIEFSLKTENYGAFGFRSVNNNSINLQIATFQPFDEWTTTYYNITNFINATKEGEYEFYINTQRGDLIGDSKTYIDNFKILQF